MSYLHTDLTNDIRNFKSHDNEHKKRHIPCMSRTGIESFVGSNIAKFGCLLSDKSLSLTLLLLSHKHPPICQDFSQLEQLKISNITVFCVRTSCSSESSRRSNRKNRILHSQHREKLKSNEKFYLLLSDYIYLLYVPVNGRLFQFTVTNKRNGNNELYKCTNKHFSEFDSLSAIESMIFLYATLENFFRVSISKL
jgi:hypothetical protein